MDLAGGITPDTFLHSTAAVAPACGVKDAAPAAQLWHEAAAMEEACPVQDEHQ